MNLVSSSNPFPLSLSVAKTLVDINEAVTGEDLDALVEALTSDYAQLRDVDPALAERYQAALLKARLEKNDSLTYEEIQSVIDQVNEQVRREHLCKHHIMCICNHMYHVKALCSHLVLG